VTEIRGDDIRNNIERQPESLRQVRAHLSGPGAKQLESAAELLAGRDRIIFTGMGGSLYALMPAATYLAQHGILVNLLDASELLYYSDVPSNAAVVALSRSGRTAEVVRLTDSLKKRSIPVIALTNCPSSTLAATADGLVQVAGDLDHGVALQTYTGGLLTGLALAAAVSGTLVQFQHDLAIALDVLESQMPVWWRMAGGWRWEERSHFFFLGRGYSVSSACEATLLMQELSRRTATWYNAAEFRQGPVEAVRRGHAVVLFSPDGETKHLNQSLAGDLAHTGAGVFQVGGGLGVPEYLAPLLQIIPIQMAAYAIAARDQETPGQFRFAAAVSEKEDGLAAG
jgi:glucosamine--fructose-6-phosphate aminotransferase (isomerizing)